MDAHNSLGRPMHTGTHTPGRLVNHSERYHMDQALAWARRFSWGMTAAKVLDTLSRFWGDRG